MAMPTSEDGLTLSSKGSAGGAGAGAPVAVSLPPTLPLVWQPGRVEGLFFSLGSQGPGSGECWCSRSWGARAEALQENAEACFNGLRGA